MLRFFQRTFLALAVAGAIHSASAFSLLGPLAPWQTVTIGYNVGGLDLGGPMNLTEEYRWNLKTVTYGFDKSFQDYFGQRGIDEVNKAMAILNSLPPVSKMSSNLMEFPEDTRRINYQANALGLYDLKSWVLGLMLEEVGLADPERYVWTLRNRWTPTQATNYVVIMRNFDPVTWNPSRYVNGVLYTYNIVEYGPTLVADAYEATVDPLAIPLTSVAGIADANPNVAVSSYFTTGVYFTGLTRDDVGGLRYLLWKKNLNVENLPANATAGTGGAWAPVGGGTGGTNAVVGIATRPGVDKINFKLINFYGSFPGYTNKLTDTYYTNGHLVSQKIQVALPRPDILFAAGDLGVYGGFESPILFVRTGTAGWANNSALNSLSPGGLNGPGVIQPPIVIAFSSIGSYIINQFPGFTDEANQVGFFGGWAAIDGTTNAPYIFPNAASVKELMDKILSGQGGSASSPWTVVGGTTTTTTTSGGTGGGPVPASGGF